jgi:tetratricopeptide (TPR) repeat protein
VEAELTEAQTAYANLAAGLYPEARAGFLRKLQNDSSHAGRQAALEGVALTFMYSGNLASSAKYFDAAVAEDRSNAQLLSEAGNAHLLARDPKEATELFAKAVNLTGGRAKANTKGNLRTLRQRTDLVTSQNLLLSRFLATYPFVVRPAETDVLMGSILSNAKQLANSRSPSDVRTAALTLANVATVQSAYYDESSLDTFKRALTAIGKVRDDGTFDLETLSHNYQQAQRNAEFIEAYQDQFIIRRSVVP